MSLSSSPTPDLLRVGPLLPVTALLLVVGWGCAEPLETPGGDPAPERETIQTDAAPPTVGPYAQGIRVGHTLYLAGQLALTPGTGEPVEGDIRVQTERVMENLGAVLEAAGFTFDDVVQSQVYLADFDEFQGMNEVYGGYFSDEALPTRATVEVGLPDGFRVEIAMTAVKSR